MPAAWQLTHPAAPCRTTTSGCFGSGESFSAAAQQRRRQHDERRGVHASRWRQPQRLAPYSQQAEHAAVRRGTGAHPAVNRRSHHPARAPAAGAHSMLPSTAGLQSPQACPSSSSVPDPVRADRACGRCRLAVHSIDSIVSSPVPKPIDVRCNLCHVRVHDALRLSNAHCYSPAEHGGGGHRRRHEPGRVRRRRRGDAGRIPRALCVRGEEKALHYCPISMDTTWAPDAAC